MARKVWLVLSLLLAMQVGSAAAESPMALSLDDAIAMAIENNLNVEIARHDPLIAWERNRAAWGAYDPLATLEITRASTETPIASALQATSRTEDEVWSNQFTLSGVVPILSTQYEIRAGGDRTKTNRSIATLREQWDSTLMFSISQPLLRNLYWNEPWTEVKVSKQFYRQSLDQFKQALMDIVRGVEESYWALVAADEQQRVAKKSLEAAKELLEQTKVQYDVGVVSKVEVFEAEAGVAERDVDLIVARNNLENTGDRLVDQVFGEQLTAGSTLRVNPTDRPDSDTSQKVDVEAATEKAMERRPELSSIDRQIRQQEIQLASSRNQLAPQVDLKASYGYQGLSGKPCDPAAAGGGTFSFCSGVPPDIHSSFSHSTEDFFDHDGAVNWSVGGVFSIPLGNHVPRAKRRSAEIELRRARTTRSRQVQDIILEVREAARGLQSSREGIQAAERRRLAAEEQFRAESIRLEQGESTPFDVLQRERDLVEAESQKINAFRAYRDSVVELERAQGTILERHNIVVDEARRLR